MSALSEEQQLDARGGDAHEQSAAQLDEHLRDLARLQEIVQRWEDTQILTVTAVRETVETLHAEALRRLIRAVKDVPEARAALREAVADPLVRSVLDYHGLLKAPAPSLEDRVKAALESVRPQIQEHGGDVEFVAIRPPDTVEVRLVGNCKGCPASSMTLHYGVEEAVVKAAPEIKRVVQVKGPAAASNNELVQLRTSPFATLEGHGFVSTVRVDELSPDAVQAVDVKGVSVLLTLAAGEVKAYRNACSHLGMPLDEGALEEGILTCPHHGFEFAVATGECLTAPQVTLAAVESRIENGKVWIKAP